jgi:hypothetical protein
MPHPGRVRTWLWAILGIVFDLPAIAGLVLVVAGATRSWEGLTLLLAGAALGLCAIPGAVFSTIAFLQLTRRRLPRPARITIAIVLCSCSVLAGPVGVAAGLAAIPNPAADRIAALEREVGAEGGTAICTNGDPGLGPDNVRPWRDAWYRVPARAGLSGRLARSAAGRELGLTGTATTLRSTRPGIPVVVEIASSSHLYCGAYRWDTVDRAPAGSRIVRVSADAD